MRRLESMVQAQRFVGAHAAVANLFNLGRHLVAADHYPRVRQAAFASWNRATASEHNKELLMGFAVHIHPAFNNLDPAQVGTFGIFHGSDEEGGYSVGRRIAQLVCVVITVPYVLRQRF